MGKKVLAITHGIVNCRRSAVFGSSACINIQCKLIGNRSEIDN